jgi:lipoprotein-releasing system ATP-binding protein
MRSATDRTYSPVPEQKGRPVLRMSGVSKNFGALSILKGVDLELLEGESAAILGPSGSGKSTLLHIAGLMERPSGGCVFIEGRDVGEMSEDAKARERLNTIGFLFQFHHLMPDFNVLENALIPLRLAGDDLASADGEARELLARLGLQDRLGHMPHQLSGGEQQRVALARAVIRNPKLLLCDEPTGNLDLRTSLDVMALIWGEGRRAAGATIVVTHNEAIADQAQRSFTLSDGRLVER